MENKSKTHGIKFIDKFGYALGDMGGVLTFSLIGAFQNQFYTGVLGIDPAKIAIIILLVRIWDAINDPMWGAFVDSRKPTKYGRFRPYILGFSVPLAISSILMFTKFPGWSETAYLVFALITYVFYEMMYTAVNIPYGSLASVITDDEKERSSLSMWRSIGAGIGGLPATIILPMIVYNITGTTATGEKIKVIDSTKFTTCVIIFGIISIIAFFAHFKLTKERIVAPPKVKGEYNVWRSVIDLLKSRPYVMICLASMLLVGYQFYYQSTYTYLFTDFYHKPELYSMVTICTYLPMAIFIPFMNKLIDKFGKKELCTVGMAVSSVANLILFLIKTTNPYVFLVFTFISGLGLTFLVLEVWALAMDVIDYHELKTHRCEEGTAYAVFSFMRKLGQALAGVGLNVLLVAINYDVDAAKAGIALSDDVVNKIYDISTLVPAIALGICTLVLGLGYNLSKKKLAEVHEQLNEYRQSVNNK